MDIIPKIGYFQKKKETLLMKASTKQIICIVLFFAVLIAGLFLSKFYNFGISKPKAEYEKYEQGARLDRIRKGMSDK